MKKLLFTLCFAASVSMTMAQLSPADPPVEPAPLSESGSRAITETTCDNEKGTFDYPFTEFGLTVTGTGTGSFVNYAPGFTSCGITCKPNCVWIGLDAPGTFTNTFSQPVNNMVYNLTGTDAGEVFTIIANAGITSISYVDGTCPEFFQIAGNQITCTGEPDFNASGGRFLVSSTTDFTSVAFSHPGTLNGTVITMCFDKVFESIEVPVSNWALFIGIGLILVFALVRFRKMA